MTFRSLGKHIYLAIEKAASDQVQRRHCVNIRETLEVVIMMNKEELYTFKTRLAIFNSVVEIYKPLIKEYHTSTLMALA